jgi:hypothetical protein
VTDPPETVHVGFAPESPLTVYMTDEQSIFVTVIVGIVEDDITLKTFVNDDLTPLFVY